MVERGPSESWSEYRRLVLAQLEQFEREIEELKKVSQRVDAIEKLAIALKRTVYGSAEDATKSLRNRVGDLEHFRDNHPCLTQKTEDGEGEKTNKKMLVLLVGAVSGLIALASKLVEVVADLVGKIGS